MENDSEKLRPRLIPVRNLVEFVLQTGDITPGGFQRRDRAQLGTKGHRQVQRNRPEGYQAEVEIAFQTEDDRNPLEVRGRIDGLFSQAGLAVIEEIKTTTLGLELLTEDHNPLHWAQAQCYAFMYAHQQGLNEVGIHLTYFHIDSYQEKTFERTFSFPELELFFHRLLIAYANWFDKVAAWQDERDRSIQRVGFPYEAYRPGQREMAVEVYKTIRDGSCLYLQAPTGVGKTIAALFPAIKALGEGLASKLFYLTAKTPGRMVTEKALEDLRKAGLSLRSVTLTAKEKICFCPPVNCDPQICPFARGYFDKVKLALGEMDHHQAFTRPVIEELARKHEICPFEFSLDLALWVDCIICDYNYIFDPRVYLHRFFDFDSEPYVFLVDEAHNMPERAREMYSAEVNKKPVLELRRSLKPHLPALAKKLEAINKILLGIRKACQQAGRDALVEHELPETLLAALREFSQKAEDWLVLNHPAEFRQELLEFYFICLNYLRTAEYFDSFYISYFERQGQFDLKARLFCLDPAPMLASRLERSRATVFFSATLLPIDYFMKLLTGSATHPWRIFQSPFPRENACLLIHNRISTKYEKRADSYTEIAEAIATTCKTRTGNYLVYFPSYAYLNAVREQLEGKLPADKVLVQDRSMSEIERDAFLSHFSAENQETLVGLAVMGGIFGEGIDLVGERLIGVVVIGVGVPQIGLERDLLKQYFDEQNGSGFAYAYQYPGFNRVLQATGRVIRTENDRGIIALIDDRFTQARYRKLFPSHWRGYHVVANTKEMEAKLIEFWL